MERWLEIVNDKLSGNPLFSNYIQVSTAAHSRLDKMESRVEKLAVKVEALSTTSKARVACTSCCKSNHLENNSFISKTCLNVTKKAILLVFAKQTMLNIRQRH